MVNNLKNITDPLERKKIAETPELLDFMVAAYGVHPDLVVFVREATSLADAKVRAEEAIAKIKPAPTTGHTVSDVYVATGEDKYGPAKCTPPERWDPITQTCVPM